MSEMPYSDERLAKMKQDIADRTFNVKMKGALISAAFFAVALGAMFLFPAALGAAAPLVGLIGAAGGTIATFVTMKEAKKLQIDEEYLQSYMQGKNYWKAGYVDEVAKPGYGFGPQQIPMGVNPNRGRES